MITRWALETASVVLHRMHLDLASLTEVDMHTTVPWYVASTTPASWSQPPSPPRKQSCDHNHQQSDVQSPTLRTSLIPEAAWGVRSRAVWPEVARRSLTWSSD